MNGNFLSDSSRDRNWADVFVERREGYRTSVTDYHEHAFYEINLIFSGNIKVLLRDRFVEGCENRIVLTAPHTPHYITCQPDTLYSRLYLLFTDAYAAEFLPAWESLSAVFGENGNTVRLTPSETLYMKDLIEEIDAQPSDLGKKLLIYYLLLRISELSGDGVGAERKPQYLMDAIAYIEANYAKRIVAEDLARMLYIGRTTLMTEFKRLVGCTLNEYITDCRLKNAVRFLSEGEILDAVAEKCGFADSSGLSRAFRRRFGCSPRQYLRKISTGRASPRGHTHTE